MRPMPRTAIKMDLGAQSLWRWLASYSHIWVETELSCLLMPKMDAQASVPTVQSHVAKMAWRTHKVETFQGSVGSSVTQVGLTMFILKGFSFYFFLFQFDNKCTAVTQLLCPHLCFIVQHAKAALLCKTGFRSDDRQTLHSRKSSQVLWGRARDARHLPDMGLNQ